MSLKLQVGINCIRVSEKEDFCRLAACTVGGGLAYKYLNLDYGICKKLQLNHHGRLLGTANANLH